MRCKMFSPPKLRGKYLDKVLSSGWYTVGPMNDRLEEAVAEFWGVGKENVLLTSSATAACWAIMDFITRNYCSVGAEITGCTFPGIFMVDRIRPRDGLHPRPVQILTDIGGAHFIDPPGCCRRNDWVIHDLAHSWFLREGENNPDFAFTSFYPTKLAPGAEGGVLYMQCPDVKEQIRWLINCGIVPGSGVDGGVRWGRPSHMGDVQAALNLEALGNAPNYIAAVYETWEHLAELARHYDIPYRDQPVRPYLFQIKTDEVALVRDKLRYYGWCSQHNFPPAPLVTLPTNVLMPEELRLAMISDVRTILDANK
jgi:dTDP-4-amino-4,6-dideoxygalactose transaminase